MDKIAFLSLVHTTLHQTEIGAIYVLCPFNLIAVLLTTDIYWEFFMCSIDHRKGLAINVIVDDEVFEYHSYSF